MQDKFYQSTLALAGMVQALTLVKDLAQTGKTDDSAFQASIHSILEINPTDIRQVYQDLSGLRHGLNALLTLFNQQPKQGQSLLRYVMAILHLEKKIRLSPLIQDKLKKRILQTKKQADYFYLTHPTVIANLADIYFSTVHPFRFRIIVWGNPRLLNTPDIMEKIRALLLAAIRSAVLWRQMGGSRLHLLFQRKKLKTTAEKILAQLTPLDHFANEKERS